MVKWASIKTSTKVRGVRAFGENLWLKNGFLKNILPKMLVFDQK